MHAPHSTAKEGHGSCSREQRSAPEEFLCPICLEVISEATWLVNTRQLFDLKCLVHWFEAGGRTCPQTGLPLPDQVRLRAAPGLQHRIYAWAAEHGLEVPAPPAAASAPAAGASSEAPAVRPSVLARLRTRLTRLARRLRALIDKAPILYPALVEANWAARLS